MLRSKKTQICFFDFYFIFASRSLDKLDKHARGMTYSSSLLIKVRYKIFRFWIWKKFESLLLKKPGV